MDFIVDHEMLPQSLETNFWTWSAQGKVNPIPVTRSKGVYFWDVDGKRYLDFNSMVMCVNIGHGNERVIEAIVNQARELPFAGPGMATRPRALLGKLLKEIAPEGLNRFLYTLGGADAIGGRDYVPKRVCDLGGGPFHRRSHRRRIRHQRP